MNALWKHEGGNLVYRLTDSTEVAQNLRLQGFLTLNELYPDTTYIDGSGCWHETTSAAQKATIKARAKKP